jgi:methyl-accepting chemotaxis protein
LQLDGAIIQVRAAIRTLGVSGLAPERRQRQYQILERTRELQRKAREIYEPLPQSEEEAKEWQAFLVAFEQSVQENNTFLELSRRFDELGIPDPAGFHAKIEQFTKDHYVLVQHVLHMLYQDQGAFHGGEEHTACNAGQFFPTFTTTSAVLQQELRTFQDPHRRFHEAVKLIKEQVQAGQREQARTTYVRQMQPAMKEVFASFERMLDIAVQAEEAQAKMVQIMMGPAARAQNVAQEAIAKVVEINRQLAEEISKEAIDAAHLKEKLVWIFSLIAVIAAIALGLIITRKITLPVNDLVSLMTRVKDKQVFDARVEVKTQDEIGDAGNAFNSMLEAVESVMNDINKVMATAAQGRFNERVSAEARGDLDRLKTGLNASFAVIQKAIDDVAMVANALAEGNLTVRVVDNHPGQFGELKDALNATMDRMTEIVSTIMESAEVVKNASDEIASGNADMSKRAEEQASSLEETASSMEELTGAVQQNAENASRANQLAITTRGTAETGGEVVNQAVTAMGAINESSTKIADIIGVIDEIAFQTNLLALNASVEAARAGEQGRGFAVVSTEVRNLAQRSASAAKEIKELIQDSVGKVKMGSDLVGKSGQTLQEIVDGVKKVGDIIAEIAAASKQQTSGIEQVNQAVAQMDDITQRNAALAEEASANSENLNAQAVSMAEQMGFFKIDGSAHAHRPAVKRSVASKPQQASRSAPTQSSSSSAPKVDRKVSKPSDDEWEEF